MVQNVNGRIFQQEKFEFLKLDICFHLTFHQTKIFLLTQYHVRKVLNKANCSLIRSNMRIKLLIDRLALIDAKHSVKNAM